VVPLNGVEEGFEGGFLLELCADAVAPRENVFGFEGFSWDDAELGEDRWTAGETCALLLAALRRRAPDSETVREHAQDDGGAAGAGRLGNAGR